MSALPIARGRFPAGAVAAIVALIVLASVPVWATGFTTGVATRIVVFALFGLGFNVVFGAGGMPSLGHAAFFGVGGYLLGIGVTRWDLGLARVLVLAIVVGALLGIVVGLLTLRSSGVYLLLLTLAVGQAVWGLAFQQVRLTGGDNGIAGLPRAELAPGGGHVATFYWFVLGLATVVALALWWFQRSPAGVAIVAHRESSSRLAALGYRVGAYRVTAFGVSGSVAAIAGVLYALQNRFVGPENLSWQMSAEVMLFAIVGGATFFAGPVVGAIVLVSLETWVSGFTDRWVSILGLTYILSMLYLPRGVLGMFSDLGQWWRRRRRPPEGPVAEGDAPTADVQEVAP